VARLYRHKRHGWQLVFEVYFPDGSRKRKSKFFSNKVKAERFLALAEELEQKSYQGLVSQEDLKKWSNWRLLSTEEVRLLGGKEPIEAPSLGEFAAKWLEERKYKVRKSTSLIEPVHIKNLLSFFGSDRPLNSITKEDMENYRIWRLKSVTPSTCSREMTTIALFFDRAAELGFIDENPARKLKPLRERKERQPRAMTREELKRFFEVVKQNRHLLHGMAYEIFLTYYLTGMRRQELLYLEWEDLDFERRKIKIQAKIEKDGFITKTGYAREVGMSKTLAEVLSKLPRKGRYVFGGDTPLIHPHVITDTFRMLRKKAGLPPSITLHSLRHTYITYLMEKGINPKRVQELAGHKSFATTWRYAHALPSDKIEEDMLEEELG